MEKNEIGGTQNRRSFLSQSAALAAGTVLLPTVLTSCSNHKGANDRVVIGHIGVGSRGTDELMNYFVPLREALNIAVCDTFKDRRDSAAQRINLSTRRTSSPTRCAKHTLKWMSYWQGKILMQSILPLRITGMFWLPLKRHGRASTSCWPNHLA